MECNERTCVWRGSPWRKEDRRPADVVSCRLLYQTTFVSSISASRALQGYLAIRITWVIEQSRAHFTILRYPRKTNRIFFVWLGICTIYLYKFNAKKTIGINACLWKSNRIFLHIKSRSIFLWAFVWTFVLWQNALDVKIK